MRFRAYGLLVALLCALPLPAQAQERRFALVIGNGAYVVGGPLKNPVNDARVIEQSLKKVGFQVVRLENSTKLQMERAIRRLSNELTPDTVSVVYYAGHGIQVNGHNYLLPVDAQIDTENSVRLEGVDVDEILEQMTTAKSRVNIVILDACRNNPFERRFRSVSGGLASIDAPAGTLIAYATSPGRVAADGTGDNGLYTGELVKQIDQRGLSIEAVFKRTRIAVMQRSNGDQTPWESSSLTGDFSFQPGPTENAAPAQGKPGDGIAPALSASNAPASQSAPTLEKERIELAFWDSIKSSKEPGDFEDYLKRYPAGDFASLAERRLQALRQPSAPQLAQQKAPQKLPDPATAHSSTEGQAAASTNALAEVASRLNGTWATGQCSGNNNGVWKVEGDEIRFINSDGGRSVEKINKILSDEIETEVVKTTIDQIGKKYRYKLGDEIQAENLSSGQKLTYRRCKDAELAMFFPPYFRDSEGRQNVYSNCLAEQGGTCDQQKIADSFCQTKGHKGAKSLELGYLDGCDMNIYFMGSDRSVPACKTSRKRAFRKIICQ